MPRPPTPIGTYGVIKLEELSPANDGRSRFRASTYFRMSDGSSQRVRRTGPSRASADRRLKEALVELAREAKGDAIDGSTRFTHVVDLWLDELAQEADLGNLSPTTVRLYRGALKNWAMPSLGQLQCRELSVTGCDRVVKNARAKASYDTAKTVKAALSGACDYGVRHGALTMNPIRSVGRMTRGDEKEVVALSLEQRLDLMAKLVKFGPSKKADAKGRSLGARGRIWLDLPDIMEAMLATGVRLGELLALEADDVDPQAATVRVSHHLIRITGHGLVRRKKRKGNRDGLLLKVPAWSVPMWRRRKLASGGGPLFPSFTGEWLDPSNVINRIREAMTEVGYGWVTSHVFRKTVATVLDEADLPTTAIADQLGNTRAVAEKHYRKQRTANEANADALEDMMRKAT